MSDVSDPTAPDPSEVEQLRALVARQGGDVVAAAATEDPFALAALALDAVLIPHTDRYTLEEVAALADVEPSAAVRLWRAMGFPDPEPGARLAGDLDAQALRTAMAFMERPGGLDNGVRQTRILAAALARITELWIDEMRGALDSALPPSAALEFALPRLDVERSTWILGYVHRRLLAAGLRRELTSRSTGGASAHQAVAFADMVGYTTLSEQLGALELSRLVETFEELAYDTVAALGGRVVKTIGDEVMFTGEEPALVIAISERLLEGSGSPEVPALRIGAEFGVAVWYEGDLYGPAVNRAARIVSQAAPGTLAASRTFSEGCPDSRWLPRGTHHLKGIGDVELLELASAPG
jgi:adenylate cyclase